jgi:hypothetical protein
MSKTPEQVAYDLTSGEPFVQLSTFEREWAKNQIEAAIQEERDTALQQCANGVAKLEAVGSILGRNGCDCECDHHHEEHDTDCERCLACLVGDILAIETDATATPSAQESSGDGCAGCMFGGSFAHTHEASPERGTGGVECDRCDGLGSVGDEWPPVVPPVCPDCGGTGKLLANAATRTEP